MNEVFKGMNLSKPKDVTKIKQMLTRKLSKQKEVDKAFLKLMNDAKDKHTTKINHIKSDLTGILN